VAQDVLIDGGDHVLFVNNRIQVGGGTYGITLDDAASKILNHYIVQFNDITGPSPTASALQDLATAGPAHYVGNNFTN